MKNRYKFKRTSIFSCFGCGCAGCSMCPKEVYKAKSLKDIVAYVVKQENSLSKALVLLVDSLEET